MRKSVVLISTPTPLHTRPKEFGERYLKVFFEEFPGLKPQTVSYTEPINKPVATIEDALEYWGQLTFYWRRKNAPQTLGSVTETGNFGPDGVSLQCHWNNSIDWFGLFLRLIEIAQSNSAYIHYFTKPELVPIPANGPESSFWLGAAGAALRDGIPGIGWANYFGGDYAKEVDPDLLRENGFEVEPFESGYIFKVSPDITDVKTDYEAFDKRRQLLRSLFREGVFQKPSQEA